MAKRSDQSHLRVPPHSIEAEQAVLGSVMLDPSILADVNDVISPADFYRRDHQFLYRAMQELDAKGEPIDAVSIGEWLRTFDVEDLTGGMAYAVHLAETTPSPANARHHARIVRSKALLRQIIERATLAIDFAFNPLDLTDEQVVAKAQDIMNDIGVRDANEMMSMLPAVRAAIADLHHRFENPGSLRGVSTGLRDLDAKTLGLRAGQLVVVAGRPAMGKSTLGQAFVEALLEKTTKAAVLFTLEMSDDDWAGRMLVSRGRIDANRFQSGQLTEEDWPKINAAATEVVGWHGRLHVCYQSSISPEVMRSRTRRLLRENDIGLIVVDYLQLMTAPDSTENRATEVAAISRALKGMAKDFKVPVVAIAQLNRGPESRIDKRPNLADLRESGAIEQDADIVLLLYRDEYYHRDSEDRGIAEIIVAKQRNGEVGTVRSRFIGNECRFADL